MLLALPFAAAGIAIGCVKTAERSTVARLARAHLRGSAVGLFATIRAGGNAPASALTSIVWTDASTTAAIGYLPAWMLLAS